MNPRLKQALIMVAAAPVAVWLSMDLASGDYFWPALATALALGLVLSRLLRLETDVILVGLVVIGYLVGSRGFAQVTLVRGLPLLPAEVALGAALAWRGVRCAFERRLPFTRDALNWAVLAWVVLGGARIGFDVAQYSFVALRDFAMVYYALFFFLIRHMAQENGARNYLLGCVLTGCIGLVLVYPLTISFPAFFARQLVLNDAPLVYHKEDLVQTFFAAGGVLLFHWARGRQRYWAWPLTSLVFLLALTSDVRAAMVGGVIAMAVLLLARRWNFAAVQGSLAVLGLTALLLFAQLPGDTWAGSKLDTLVARVATIFRIDAPGVAPTTMSYKVDNNRFRLVWWRSVGLEVWNTNPLFGLGFGHDLAAGFLRDYDQELGEEFLARSPHSIAVSALGRMGLVGAAVWLWFCIAFARQGWRGLQSNDEFSWGTWGALVVVLVSATFGVVLEGPMGAVPFWVLLGLASVQNDAAAAEKTASGAA